jgi:hypothetical protein
VTIVPLVDSPRALAGWLARRWKVEARALAAACREERPLANPLRADDAATIAVAAGLSLLARTVAREEVAAELERVAHLGLLLRLAGVEWARVERQASATTGSVLFDDEVVVRAPQAFLARFAA